MHTHTSIYIYIYINAHKNCKLPIVPRNALQLHTIRGIGMQSRTATGMSLFFLAWNEMASFVTLGIKYHELTLGSLYMNFEIIIIVEQRIHNFFLTKLI